MAGYTGGTPLPGFTSNRYINMLHYENLSAHKECQDTFFLKSKFWK